MIVAGPNGSGKTTLTRLLQSQGVDFGEYINPDDIAATLEGSYDERVRAAQREADRRRDACLAERRSFSFETVMSHPSKVELLERAAADGWVVNLYFVATDRPEINVNRVASRVRRGGHDVPPDRIIERYARTLSLFPRALAAARFASVFDNTSSGADAGLRVVLSKTDQGVALHPPTPDWLRSALR